MKQLAAALTLNETFFHSFSAPPAVSSVVLTAPGRECICKMRKCRWTRLVFGAATAGGMGAVGLWVWSRPTYNSVPTPHDPITVGQCHLLRMLGADAPITPDSNPGARTFANFLASETDRQAVLEELQPLKQAYGITLIQAVHGAIYRCPPRGGVSTDTGGPAAFYSACMHEGCLFRPSALS
jgi:hypothetical protein